MTAIRIISLSWPHPLAPYEGLNPVFLSAVLRLNGSDLCALLVWRCGRNDICAIVVHPHAPCIVDVSVNCHCTLGMLLL